jgi:predicted TIM-barrel fold metal-dependent hydrolase
VSTIDFHRHVWPEQLVEALSRRSGPPCLRGAELLLPGEAREIDVQALRPETCLTEMDRLEIEIGVVSLAPTLAFDADEELIAAYEEGVRQVTAESGGRIVALGAGGSRAGFPGTCVGASRLADLDALAPLLADLEQHGRFLYVHPDRAGARDGAPPWWVPVVDYTAQLQAAYASWLAGGGERWPGLNVVFASLAGGAPFQLERLLAFGIGIRDVLSERVFFETSSYGKRALELCLATFGVEQLVFGSDAPVLDPERGLDAVRSFGDAVASSLCVHNPTRVLS